MEVRNNISWRLGSHQTSSKMKWFVHFQYNEINADHPPKSWKPLTDVELKSFVGLLILTGVFKSNREQLDELWSLRTGSP